MCGARRFSDCLMISPPYLCYNITSINAGGAHIQFLIVIFSFLLLHRNWKLHAENNSPRVFVLIHAKSSSGRSFRKDNVSVISLLLIIHPKAVIHTRECPSSTLLLRSFTLLILLPYTAPPSQEQWPFGHHTHLLWLIDTEKSHSNLQPHQFSSLMARNSSEKNLVSEGRRWFHTIDEYTNEMSAVRLMPRWYKILARRHVKFRAKCCLFGS